MFNMSLVTENASFLNNRDFGVQDIPPRTQETWTLLLVVSVLSTLLFVFLFIACGWACFNCMLGRSGRFVFLRNAQMKYLQGFPPPQRELINMERIAGEINPAFDKEETLNRTGPSSRLGYKNALKNETVPKLPSLKGWTPSPPLISEVHKGSNSNRNSMRCPNPVREGVNPGETVNPVYCKNCALERTNQNIMHGNACDSSRLMIHNLAQAPSIPVNQNDKYENRYYGIERDIHSDDSSNEEIRIFCPRNKSIYHKQPSCATNNLHHSCPQRLMKCLAVPPDRLAPKPVSRQLNRNFTCEKYFHPYRPETTTENFEFQLPSPYERKNTKQAFELKLRNTNSNEKKMSVQEWKSGLIRNNFQDYAPAPRKKRKLEERKMETLDPRETEKEMASENSADFASALSRSSKMYWKICQLEDEDENTKEDSKIIEDPTDSPSMSWDSLNPNHSPIEENESEVLVLNPAAGTGYFSQQGKTEQGND